MSKNQTTRYLKYAIGEIVLVVIGILIALQINTMRENSIERKKEQAYLKEINLDFRSNKAQLDSIIEHNLKALDCCKKLQTHIAKINTDSSIINDFANYSMADSLFYYQRFCFTNKSFNPKNGTVRALINSSSFDLIQNDTLRRYLVSWNDVLGDYLEEEEFAMNFLFKEYYPYNRASYDYSKFFGPENIKAWFNFREYNYRETRKGDLGNLLETVESEGVVHMINDILRLTETDNSYD